MTPDELLHLITQGEGQRIDFKEEAIKPGWLAETLVAFANTKVAPSSGCLSQTGSKPSTSQPCNPCRALLEGNSGSN
jgi:hypothetical protein